MWALNKLYKDKIDMKVQTINYTIMIHQEEGHFKGDYGRYTKMYFSINNVKKNNDMIKN